MPTRPSRASPAAASGPASRRDLQAAVRGAVALAGTREAAVLAGLIDAPMHAVVEALARPDGAAAGTAGDDAVAAWLRADPATATAAIERTLRWQLGRGAREAAARLALALGTPAQIATVLEQAGWTLMHGALRDLVGALLDRLALAPHAASPRLQWLRLAWQVEVERLPHDALRALQADPAFDRPRRLLLCARIAQMFDLPHDALADAQQAAATFDDDLEPEGLQALHALGFALLEAGRPREALEPLQRLLRACDRDVVPLLQLDALHVLARVHDELGDDAALRRVLAAARAAAAPAPPSLPALQGLERLRRALQLRGLDDDAAQRLEPLAPRESDESYNAFPQIGLDALDALRAGDTATAAAHLDALDERQARAFHCRKWRLEALHLRLWLAARRGDTATLAQTAGDTVPVDATATLYDLHHAVLVAAAAALGGAAVDAARRAGWQALDERLAAAGLQRLRRRLALVRALDGDDDGLERLGDWLAQAAGDGDVIDARWLAPKLAARLDAWLASPAAARRDAERTLAQRLLAEMLAPAPSADPVRAARAVPADLTAREWEILQLIGARLTNEQIATRLFVSVATVKTHINRVYAKLGIASRAEAVQRARDLA
jgi:ATP/maltotriose-dependent transcriptional regulator MalT